MLLPLDVVHNQLGRLRVQLRRAVFMQVGWVTACSCVTVNPPDLPFDGARNGHAFRVYSGSWELPHKRPHRAGDGCARSGQAPAWPLSSDRVSIRSPGSSVTSSVRSPGTFPLCSSSCGYSHAIRLEGRTRTLSGPSPDLTPARTPALSASPASACQGMRWQRQPVQAGGVFGRWPPRPAVTRAARPKLKF